MKTAGRGRVAVTPGVSPLAELTPSQLRKGIREAEKMDLPEVAADFRAELALREAASRSRKNPAEPIFVSIRRPDGHPEKVIRCASGRECAEVVREESRSARPFTTFMLIGEENGRPEALDRWTVDDNGRLVHRPLRSRAALADTAPGSTREAKTRKR